jgi:hypothetical protein
MYERVEFAVYTDRTVAFSGQAIEILDDELHDLKGAMQSQRVASG